MITYLELVMVSESLPISEIIISSHVLKFFESFLKLFP